MKKIFLRTILCINSHIVAFSFTMLLLLLCTPICAENLHLPNWQSTNAGESSSTSSYTYKFTTSSSGSTLSFDWRVSSESGYDFLTITLDGAQILKESGTKSSSYSKYLNDDNEHTLVCTYSKDGSVDNGDDCASVNNVVVKTMNNTSNPVVIPNNTIYYTSSDDKIVTLNHTDAFRANIISNTYENGQGIITFDGDVTSIGYEAFYGCSGLTSITIPNSVTSIGAYAFCNCSGLTSITIPNSVTSIGYAAFYNCSGLTSITIPNSVTSIGNDAFSLCSGLTSITIPSSVTSIVDWAFYGCSGLTSITIPNSVTSIGNHAFYNCSGLTSITIPNSVTSIGYAAFYNCSGLTSITIPNSVTSIGDEAFYNCSGLTSIVVNAQNADYDSRDNCNAIIETSTNTLLWGCKNTVIPNSVTSIGDAAFYNCSGLTSITIPSSVTSIGKEAFCKCSGLTSITIPNSVTSIGDRAFWACTSLTSITIPNSVTSIGKNIIMYCPDITSVSVEQGNANYDSRNNCNAIIETATNTLISGCKNTIIPNSVTSIGVQAFGACTNLTYITIPNSVTSIGYNAFGSCFGLSSVIIGNSVTSIGEFAFEKCTGLTSVTIGNSVTNIGYAAFVNCSGLTSITIPNSVTSIETYAFDGCSGLTSVTNLSTTPQSVEDNTFGTYGTLHVIPGCKSAYENADVWKNFTIVEDAVDPFASLVLADGKTYNGTATQENKDITYTRTFNNTSWQSLYIPFSMTYDDWKDDFEVAYINAVRQIDTDDDGAIDETIMDVVKIKSGSLIPNTPYLIKAKTIGNKTITVNDATLYKAESNSVDCSTTIAKYTFTGTYSTIPAATLLANNYYAMGGGSLIMTDGTSDLKPFRWYLNMESRSPMYNVSSGAKAIKINVVGEENTTGITQYANDSSTNSKMYDINGRIVNHKSLKPGLYIKNGKKIIVK